MQRKKSPEQEDDVVFDTEDNGGNSTDLGALITKLDKIKKELAACKKERQEYLDGWQRLRADVANSKKGDAERSARAIDMGKEALFSALLPALDSFDAAMTGEAWQKVDSNWRVGVEYIHTQLTDALTQEGIMAFGSVGEPFDAMMHEAVEEVTGGEVSGTIERVVRRGYRLKDKILRPARVVVHA